MSIHASHGRHAANRGFLRFFSLRSMIITAVTLIAAISIAVIATGGTYALWNKSAQAAPAATITAGTANLTVSSLTLPTSALAPGRTIYGSTAVANTGTVPLALSATLSGPTSSTTFSQALTLGFGTAATAAACASFTPSSTATFASASTAAFGTLPLTATSGSPLYVCVSVTLASTVATGAQGQTASTFRITLSGVQS
ncbi:hypothetical protein [Glaciihabitans sp. UYNi722]|uniref:hypothetical protein n=1 Tax=Glaciihabitans sp. UYNi722 TaxID=3156344 RepID=UPI0033962723